MVAAQGPKPVYHHKSDERQMLNLSQAALICPPLLLFMFFLCKWSRQEEAYKRARGLDTRTLKYVEPKVLQYKPLVFTSSRAAHSRFADLSGRVSLVRVKDGFDRDTPPVIIVY